MLPLTYLLTHPLIHVANGVYNTPSRTFSRAADLLAIDETLLIPSKNAEDLQVVHYENGQKYDSHHDWGVSGHPESRLVTLLLYLSDQKDLYAGTWVGGCMGIDLPHLT